MTNWEDGNESNFERDLYMMEVDVRAANAVDKLNSDRVFKERFCREYSRKIKPGIDVTEAAVQALVTIGVLAASATAAVAILKVARIGIGTLCEEFSAQSSR